MSICTKSPGGAQKKKFFHLQFLEIWYCICWWRRWSKCTLTWECFGNCYSQGEVWIQLIRNVCSKPTPLQQPKNPTVLYHNDIIRLIESLAAIKTIHAALNGHCEMDCFKMQASKKSKKTMKWCDYKQPMPAITHNTTDYRSSTLHFAQPLPPSLYSSLSLAPRKGRTVWQLERSSN